MNTLLVYLAAVPLLMGMYFALSRLGKRHYERALSPNDRIVRRYGCTEPGDATRHVPLDVFWLDRVEVVKGKEVLIFKHHSEFIERY